MSFDTPVVIGNWKMNGLRAEAEALVTSLLEKRRRVPGGTFGVCPPATAISDVADLIGDVDVMLGAQDCSPEEAGAFTGDISAPMVADAGCQMVIIGHSERRHGHGESSELVARKVQAAHRHGLIAIICIGETEAEWEAGETLAVLDRQIEESLPDGVSPANTIIAYEPVWAIGTGRTPTIDDIARTHAHIGERLTGRIPHGAEIRLLYGGSVKGKNAPEILAAAGVDGALVGGASLDAAEFWSIFEAGHVST